MHIFANFHYTYLKLKSIFWSYECFDYLHITLEAVIEFWMKWRLVISWLAESQSEALVSVIFFTSEFFQSLDGTENLFNLVDFNQF